MLWSLLLVILIACSPAESPPPLAATASPSREPPSLPVFDWEARVVDSLAVQGLHVTRIGLALEAGALGRDVPTRSFIVTPGAAGATVMLIGAAGIDSIRVCPSLSVSGRTHVIVYVNGLVASSSDAASPPSYLRSTEFFAIVTGDAVRSALLSGLALQPASC